MKAVIASIIRLLAGGLIALVLPREGLIEGSTRIIPFFALLMAGVFPAMMQTVTVLKGDDLSPKAVKEYGEALKTQLHFWAALFASALTAIGFLVLAVIVSKAKPLINLPANYLLDRNFVVDILLFLFGAAGSALLLRFIAAYGGVKSLLVLNLKLAELKSRKALDPKVKSLSTPQSSEGPRIQRL